jgi:hypothetical protein
MQKGDEAKQLAATTKERHGDKLDPSTLAKQAGKGVREARDLRDSFTGAGTSATAAGKPKPDPEAPDPDRPKT